MSTLLVSSTTRRLASRAYLVGSMLFGIVGIAAFTRAAAKPRFDEIDVERINIIAPNGKPRLVISNAERAPDVIMNGKTYHRSGSNEAGMIFYNEEGNENGGMGFSGRKHDGHVSAGGSFMFDQYGQDQTVGITYDEEDGRRSAGLRVWDRPEQPVTVLADMVEPIKLMPDGPEKTRRMAAVRDPARRGSASAARSGSSSASSATRRRPSLLADGNVPAAAPLGRRFRRQRHESSFSTTRARSCARCPRGDR